MDYLPTSALGVTKIFSTSRAGIDLFSDDLIESVKSGEANPLEVRVWIKSVEEILERVKKETSEFQLTEANKYHEKSFEFAGAKITKTELGTKYNFSICGDPIYNHRKSIADESTAQLKEREEFLKAMKEPMTFVDEGSGEIVRIIPPSKTSTSGLTVSIK